ncbi:S-adenosyl-L-methionine-dependent methyltransferase [Whalleya microplaca]|nr:S-adenosyl-L-methionine-dependent methyltransferase [Whalleya microplaca]
MADTAAHINKSYFDEEAAVYDAKHAKVNERLTEKIQSRLDFIGVDWASDDEDDDGSESADESDEKLKKSTSKPKREVRLLDYACGTGMMSRTFAPYTTQCVGIDISDKMVATYNARAENQGLSPSEMHAYTGDLASPTPPTSLSGPEFFDFDLAAVAGGLHHFADPQLAAARLVERLRPGGVLLVWDFLPHGAWTGQQHKAASTVVSHGFSEERIREIFETAGAGTGFQLEELGSAVVFGGAHGGDEGEDGSGGEHGHGHGHGNGQSKEYLKRQIFLARGEKAS